VNRTFYSYERTTTRGGCIALPTRKKGLNVSVERDRNRSGWIVRWRENGRPRTRKFTLKGDADDFDLEIKRRKQLGPLAVQKLTAPGGSTLDEWIAGKWAPQHGVNLERSTVERYANVYALHIAPRLGPMPLAEISVAELRAWQADLLGAGTGKETIKKARTFLSSVLRHAAESEAIPANPLLLVRAPKPEHHDDVRALPPSEVEQLLETLGNPRPREIAASDNWQRKRRAYTLPAPGTPETWRRDALIVSIMAYAGLRPSEVKGLRYGDIRENTIRIERATDDSGKLKATKNVQKRTVKLLGPLAQDLREYGLSVGRPSPSQLIFPGDQAGCAWTKSDWNKWSADRWKPAIRVVGLPADTVPYDLRHSFASLLLAERRQPQYVARQLGHSVAVLYKHYAHLIEEFEEATSIDAEAEIWAARRSGVCQECVKPPKSAENEPKSELPGKQKTPHLQGLRAQYRYRDSNPGYRRERAAS
jgi:integrase